MAAAGALRQLLLPTISLRLAAGKATFAGGSTTTMAQVHVHRTADCRCVRAYTTEAAAAARHEQIERLMREAARTELALPLALLSLNGAGLALAYYGPHLPRKGNL